MKFSIKLPEKFSFRTRLFVVMIIMLFVAGLLILGTTSIQYESQRENYHLGRLDRKEAQIQRHINHLVTKNDLYEKHDSVWQKFNSEFEQINRIHNIMYSLFSLDGTPLFVYHSPLEVIANNYLLDSLLLQRILKSETGNYLERYNSDIDKFHASYSVLNDEFGKSYGILFFPYFEDTSFSENELNSFLQNLYQIYIFLLFAVIFIAYFLSKYVTRSLEIIRIRMAETGLDKKNEKIYLKNATREIDSLVNSYNTMIDELSVNAAKLVKTQREEAWQEMAKQVAHEIKNPLTPMRLTIQSFQHKYDSNDPDNDERISNFSDLLIQQIDTMSDVAEAFSNFASLPKLNLKECDIVDVTSRAIKIFQQEHIIFSSNHAQIFHKLDKAQWIRVITNLIQNSLQSISKNKTPQIGIQLIKEPGEILLIISDNGKGISPSLTGKIFEPKFTTKNSGMGLGLGIIKNIIESHNGNISFVSKQEKGTTFTIRLPQ